MCKSGRSFLRVEEDVMIVWRVKVVLRWVVRISEIKNNDQEVNLNYFDEQWVPPIQQNSKNEN